MVLISRENKIQANKPIEAADPKELWAKLILIYGHAGLTPPESLNPNRNELRRASLPRADRVKRIIK